MAWRSQVPGHVWPALIDGVAAEVLALAHQFGVSQWWDAGRLRAAQFKQLHALLGHAARHVPFYRRRLREVGFDPAVRLTEALWARIPILTRPEVMAQGKRLRASVVPPERGAFDETSTGGSTGVPVTVVRDEAQMRFYFANVLRGHEWQTDDPSLPFAQLGLTPPGLTPEQAGAMDQGVGLDLPDYGAPLAWLAETGTRHLMHSSRSAADQVAFLRRVRPGIVSCKPSLLRLLLGHMRERGIGLAGVRCVWTSGEVVDEGLQALCRAVLGCRMAPNYSCNEAGFMALQCREQAAYHVCAETALIEVLDDDGRVCGPGEVGRVIVTPLHAVAQPLIRYEIGDRAEVGAPCACGRGLPVLSRILGRTRDTLLLAGGGRRYVGDGPEFAATGAVREYQLAQTVAGVLEVRLVASRRLTADEEEEMRAKLVRRIGADVAVAFTYHASLPRTGAGKLKAFVSELT